MNWRSRLSLLTTILCTGGLAASCGELNVTAVDVARIEVVPDTASVVVGATRKLSARLLDAAGNELADRAITWSSSDPAAARADGDGTVTGLAPGVAMITASSGGATGEARINVLPAPSLGAQPGRVALAVAQGGAPASEQVAITSSGSPVSGLTTSISYAQGEPTGWLVASLQGTAPPTSVQLTASAGSLAPGSYQAAVVIAGTGGASVTVLVDLQVTAPAPSIVLGASTVAFTMAASGADPAPQTIPVTNGGGGSLTGLGASITYAAGQPAGWLTASLSPSTAPSTLTLAARAGTLPQGVYDATVLITSPVAASPASLAVRFTIGAPAPAIALSETSRPFTATVGGPDPGVHAISVTNAGGGTLGGLAASVSYAPGEPADWLTALLTATTAPTTLTLQARVGSLQAGTYTATVHVASAEASNSPQAVTVTFQVTPGSTPPAIAVSQDTATFVATAGGASPAGRVVQITNAGGGTLDGLVSAVSYGAGQPTGWLTAALGSTTAPTTLTLQPATTALPAGTYNAIVQVASAAASNSPVSIAVTLQVAAAQAPPAIAVSPPSLSFTATAGGGDPAAGTIAIANGGGGTLGTLSASVQYAAGQPSGWLSTTLAATTAPTTVTVQPRTGALAAGTYTATVRIASPDASNSPQDVPVSFTVNPASPGPAIALSPTTVGFSAVTLSGNPAPKTVSITNAGGGTLGGLSTAIRYGSGQPTGWLTASLGSTTAPSTLTLQPTTGLLLPGTYTASVDVRSQTASNSPQTVAVTFQVTAPVIPPAIGLTPSSATFNATAGGAAPASQNIAVQNTGGGTLDALAASVTYAAGQPTGWLTATLSSTTAPATLVLAAATGALAAGTYTATVQVSSSKASNSPQTVAVTFVVAAAPVQPAIGLGATTATFTATEAGASPAAQSISITNAGSGTLGDLAASVQYGSGQPTGWLTATLGSTTAPTQVTLQATTGSLPAGSYSATVTISSPAASNSPRTIQITFQVNPAASAPAAVTDLRAREQGSDRIDLDWKDNSNNETHFIVQRSTSGGGGPWTDVATLPPDTQSYRDQGLQADTRYWYRVQACNSAGCSPSSTVSERTDD